MVIIKKDDYISFLNSTTGVKMPTPPNSVNSVSTIKRDNSQEQLQKLQQYTQQQTSAAEVHKTIALARAVLVCRPNSHPFLTRTLLLEPNKIVKIGRAIARTKPTDTNAIFDCKVLSRNHAELWYDDGKFFIKDAGSSNGTFINNQRLSTTCNQSEPYEVSSGDIVQFGVDVMENSRKETHGCIVATLKLYLPDGRETKASQSTMVGPVNTKVPQVDLYRLNQYIQEAVQREQILETKLLSIQKKLDLVRKSSSTSWQALIDEDRLLSRIDMLEKKLLSFSKNISEDKLREEIFKLQNEKQLYQSSAKEALKKVYNERMESIQKLATAEKALCSTEDECSLLRDQVNKQHQQSLAIQNQLDEKYSEFEEMSYKKDNELKNLKTELCELQEKLVSYKRQSEIGDYENSQQQMVANWLLKSDIKNIEGSEDIIKAICGDDDDEYNSAKNIESNCSQIYLRMFTLEKELNLLLCTNNNDSNINEPDNSLNVSELDQSQQQQQQLQLPQTQDQDQDKTDEEDMKLSFEQSAICDDNQNNMNNVNNSKLLMQSNNNIDNLSVNADRIRNNFRQLLALYAKFKKQIVQFTESKINEQRSIKAKTDELSSQIISLKLELESRPTQLDLDNKVQECNNMNENMAQIREEVTNLTDQLNQNQKLIDTLENDLKMEKLKQMRSMDRFCEIECQTDDDWMKELTLRKRDELTVDISIKASPNASNFVAAEDDNFNRNENNLITVSTSDLENNNLVDAATVGGEDNDEEAGGAAAGVESSVVESEVEIVKNEDKLLENSLTNHIKDDTELNETAIENEKEDEAEIDLLNHPKVLYEDELITFKEKCSVLSSENAQLNRKLTDITNNMKRMQQQAMNQFMLTYLLPTVIFFVAFIYYLVKS